MAVIAAAFAGCLGLSLWAKDETTPDPVEPPGPPSLEGLTGFPKAVRPWELLDRARSLTPRTHFRGFVAEGVRADGTMDFEAEGTRLRFAFQSPPGQGPQPMRPGGTRPVRVTCGKQSIKVAKKGIFAEHDVTDLPCPADDPEALPVPQKCSVEDVWKLAIDRKVQADEAARIEFFETRKGGAYRFSQGGKERFVVLAKDCTKILKGKDRRGTVP